ncbi:protein kinase domain-containing protein [Longispora albida]|uniref:protein kinase domain-containing protein n=1 Tax=Longispora albida TaxID=203523 RepID=UPI00036A766C|nr:protein kinase [Longispora albida]
MLTPGSTLGERGRYTLTERIASGGMGDVWKAEDTVLGRTVAVKVLLPALLEEPGFVERFRDEARTMATINHPGVVDVYDFGESELPGGSRASYLVMEYVQSEPLSAVLARVGRLTPQRAMALIAQAADALQAAHDAGIIHRDVKPGNLLVRPNGSLVLTDFGISRAGAGSNLTAVGSTLGTAAYMSPEQAAGQPAGPLSDVYSLGVVAYQCVAGRRPFEGDNPLGVAMMHIRDTPPALPGDVPPQIRQFVERAMAKDGAARWPSAAAMGAAARALSAGQPLPHTAAQPAAPARTSVMPAVPPADRTQGAMRGAAAVPPPPQPKQTYEPVKPPKKGNGLLIAGIAGVVAVLLVFGGIAWALIASSDKNNKKNNSSDNVPIVTTTPTPTATKSSPRQPETPQGRTILVVNCEQLKGKQYNKVEEELRKQNLKPKRNDVDDNAKKGTVVDLQCEVDRNTREVNVNVSKGEDDDKPSTPSSPSATPSGRPSGGTTLPPIGGGF